MLPDLPVLLQVAPSDPGAIGLLLTAFTLGLRHGLDWDHIAAITDVTSTSGVADEAEREHVAEHAAVPSHAHDHGGADELRVHQAAPPAVAPAPARRQTDFWRTQRRPLLLGTLYALGHALVVAILGAAALLLGAQLPEWLDPLMGRIVGLTLVVLGIWVFISLYQYARHGAEFRLRSRWMLVFDGARHLWRRFQAWLHGHPHAEPMEMSSYGPRTAFGVGMIHGIGAETGTQVLLIAAIGGAASVGLGIPMMLAFIAGLVITNSAIVVLTASSFVASSARRRIYVAIGIVAGTFSLFVGGAFLFGVEGLLPNLENLFGG
jgi:high-affinity nickel-transport protein